MNPHFFICLNLYFTRQELYAGFFYDICITLYVLGVVKRDFYDGGWVGDID